jgi:hypothetical protein
VRDRDREGGVRGEEGHEAHRDIEINDMIFRKGRGKDGVNESTLGRRVQRGWGRIIEWGTHIYRRLAGCHKAVH